MSKRTPEQEAQYALTWDITRGDLSPAAQLEYDRIKADQERLRGDRRRRVDLEREAARAGRSPFELPPVDGPCWISERLAISREWVASKEFAGKLPWNVLAYGAVSSVRPAADGGIALSGPDDLGVVVSNTVLASPEACTLLAEGLGTNPAVASAADELLQPCLEVAQAKRDVSLARRHQVDRSGTTHTFCFHRRRHLLLGIAAVAVAIGFLENAIQAPLSGWDPRIGDKGLEIWDIVAVLTLAWLGIRQFRAGVQISGGKLTIRGGFITRTVNVSEIRAVTMQSGDNLRVRPSSVPQVDLADGTSVLIHNFDCGRADRPPDPEVAASLDEFRLLLGIRADDTGRHASRQIGGAAE